MFRSVPVAEESFLLKKTTGTLTGVEFTPDNWIIIQIHRPYQLIEYIDNTISLFDQQVTHYRFSVAWTRILPDGTTSYINPKGKDQFSMDFTTFD